MNENGQMAMPTGTITLLFTDIVGSTVLWERHSDAMRLALARHDALIRSSIESRGGYVFKTVGDAFCAAFADPVEALHAAVNAQRRLGEEAWPDGCVLMVRMALHTGNCDERDGDYFGTEVNRAARLEAVAHGGQLIASAVTAEMVRHATPGVELRDLGEHRLRDLGRPIRVFQVEADGLVGEFPALRSLDNDEFLNNLPMQLTSFVGRDDELRELRDALVNHRLVTLTGAGGSGKTRLAMQLAAEVVGEYRDGVWFVDLAPVTDPALVPIAVATAMGVRSSSAGDLLDFVVATLASKSTLVVLDNCEHLIEECAILVHRTLRQSGTVRVVATSREPLGLDGEHVTRVNSLELPDDDAVAEGVDAVLALASVRLFVDRARDQRSDFALTPANLAHVVALCRRLDGIPFALELAAARLRNMGIEDIESRLDQRFRLLTGGSRSSLPRQRTLEAMVGWSFELLSEPERLMLLRPGLTY